MNAGDPRELSPTEEIDAGPSTYAYIEVWSLLLVATLLVLGSACEDRPETVRWQGEKFSVAYPAHWEIASSDSTSVEFEDLSQHGAFTYGLYATILWGSQESSPGYSVGGGSHVMVARLERQHSPYTIVVERHGATDSFYQSTTRASLDATLDQIQSSLDPPPSP